MKVKISVLMLVIALSMVPTVSAIPGDGKKRDYDTILEGEIYYKPTHYLAGEVVPLGFDPYGYNYHAHMFKGLYINSYLGGYGYPVYEGDAETYLDENPSAADLWCWPYRDVWLIMKWNDAWLSNMDRDSNGDLDRYWGFASYIGSGAWLTNHMRWEEDGVIYTSFTKFVAAPADAYASGGYWYTSDGVEIGEVIWGAFAVIQDVFQGLQYVSPASAGFGYYKP